MPVNKSIKKVLVIGSGPIIIGQAAEFDYSGSQACQALREEGLEVVLINSNPATIMTDKETADHIYIEPITLEYVKNILYTERPDGILASIGGQTGLNMAIELADDGILDELGIKLLGTSLTSINRAEDRELFKETMMQVGEKVAHSTISHNLAESRAFADENGYPVIVRPAFTMGGAGGGICKSLEELESICGQGLKLSPISQLLLEKSVAGWKELEYEVVRDNNDNCIIICNMENFDPVGVHTGDSIVVAPSQTLSDVEYQMLRSASLNIIRALDIKGGCNIQFALDPHSYDFIVIEVNPRVSRSSALASKATGYPIARIAAKIAVGLNLDEIINPITGNTFACFEPSLDYVVAKIPRWPFDKFETADRTLSTRMKATGEVMSIGRNFEEALLKAVDSLDIKRNNYLCTSLFDDKSKEELLEMIATPTDQRLHALAKALEKGATPQELIDITIIDKFFVHKLDNIVKAAMEIKKYTAATLPSDVYLSAKKLGFSDTYISTLLCVKLKVMIDYRKALGVKNSFRFVDTCAGEFEASTPYFYSTFGEKDDMEASSRDKVLVLGSGPIRIGQGIEFDYCSVHSVKTLREMGFESIIINNNPETVSTDFDISDKLYFEPLTLEHVLDVCEKEKPLGVITQFGGQTAINLAADLEEYGVKILGTSVDSIDLAENRERFLQLLATLDIPIPDGATVFTVDEAWQVAKKLGFPVLVRPSYVLGGRGMEIIHNYNTLTQYINMALETSNGQPILIDKYVVGKEIEVDGISDGEEVLIPGIMEHIERAGVHSGDSISVYPAFSISVAQRETIIKYTTMLAKSLKIVGLFNIQFVLDTAGKVYVIEVNPRASRTVPILSKVTYIPMVKIASKLIMGATLKSLGLATGLAPDSGIIAVKAPVFSFSKLAQVDTFLGPEMKSTGEVMGTDTVFKEAMKKAFKGAGMFVPKGGMALLSVAEHNREELVGIATKMKDFGFKLSATPETSKYLNSHGIRTATVLHNDALAMVKDDIFDLVLNTPTRGKIPGSFGFLLRRTTIEFNVPVVTSFDTMNVLLAYSY